MFYLLLALFVFLVSPAFAGEADVVAQENGILENTQVAFLLLSALILVVQSFAVARNVRCILWMGAWFCLSCILRELDVEDLAVPQWVVWAGSGMGRNLIMGAGWITLGVLAIKSYPELKGSFGRIARSRTAILVFIAGTMLLLGSLFDHESVMIERGKLLEEAFETIGYFLLLLAALTSRSISKM
ncbi:MAG: hypothetical protein DRP64_12165 [Verrucomicrobia bacterium]|nr:MAG: hypothetical protein DRP64_12165 [Verrucomicrobiota bacterium]